MSEEAPFDPSVPRRRWMWFVVPAAAVVLVAAIVFGLLEWRNRAEAPAIGQDAGSPSTAPFANGCLGGKNLSTTVLEEGSAAAPDERGAVEFAGSLTRVFMSDGVPLDVHKWAVDNVMEGDLAQVEQQVIKGIEAGEDGGGFQLATLEGGVYLVEEASEGTYVVTVAAPLLDQAGTVTGTATPTLTVRHTENGWVGSKVEAVRNDPQEVEQLGVPYVGGC